MPAHRRGPAGFDWLCSLRSPTQFGQFVPRPQIGEQLLSATYVGWLFDIVGF
jgi:hypothetical protein